MSVTAPVVPTVLHLHPEDNVSVATRTVPAGASIPGPNGSELVTKEKIDQGHKVCVRGIRKGEPIRNSSASKRRTVRSTSRCKTAACAPRNWSRARGSARCSLWMSMRRPRRRASSGNAAASRSPYASTAPLTMVINRGLTEVNRCSFPANIAFGRLPGAPSQFKSGNES